MKKPAKKGPSAEAKEKCVVSWKSSDKNVSRREQSPVPNVDDKSNRMRPEKWSMGLTKEKPLIRPGTVADSWNPSYSGV